MGKGKGAPEFWVAVVYPGTMLFEVDPIDGLTYTAIIVFLLIVVAIASYLPARRAARIDPMVVLRRQA